MDTQSLISILMPAYNVQDYVEEAISSLLVQTYKNIEIIVVDDCSSDNTFLLLEKLARQDSRIRIFSKEKNSGIVDTLNYGLQFCQGEYIARMDADDISYPDRLELLYNFLQENSKIDIVGSSTITINMDGEERQISRVPVGKEKITRTLCLFSPCFHIWLARKDVYANLNGYRAVAPAEDYDFLLRAVTSDYGIDNIDKPLMKIRCRDGNTADIAGLKQRKAHNYVIELYKDRLAHHSRDDDFTLEDYQRAIAAEPLEKKCYDFSVKLIKKGFMQKNKIVRTIFFILSSLVSRWQFKYAFNRVLFKLYLKK